MNDKAFLDAWSFLTATFGDPSRSPVEVDAKARAYQIALADLADDQLARAVGRCLRECQRFPLPKDILDRVPGRLDPKTEAENAWTRALKSATDGPGDHNPATGWQPSGHDLDDETLAAAGGQRGLRRILDVSEDTEQLGWTQRAFLARWEAVRGNVAAGRLPDGGGPAAALKSGERKRIAG